ncbi:TrkH family potassium uptake protein [Promicromonospora thailandica]|uniref:Potassium uptake protein, TrkH family n=1 Tax=Promicromonospora thailandica TaxID=765201 RepID=A0A9X2JX04_9MICO|nr:potassium transporter TrkG [Promicromonospora thailandica]MCP2267180.1 potassium uptake protein, TrkH family [Promicromonospora thailandica]BFF17516.1 potassium transporter TrkG [Promicromonospora thailandica]
MRFSGLTNRDKSRGAALQRRPGQLVIGGFLAAVAVGTGLLLLPVSASGESATLMEAVFTATSAVCVTGLIVTDTPVFWSGFGEAVILVLIQIGGLGVMTVASLLGVLVSRRLDLRSRLVAAASTRTVGLGDVRRILVRVVVIALVVEAVVAAVLTVRFAVAYDQPLGRAVWQGLFHAVSAYNNAGFALFSGSLMDFVSDPWICIPTSVAMIVGGLGLPVVLEVLREGWRLPCWSLHTKITLLMTALLLGGGTGFFLVAEADATMARLGVADRLLASFTQAANARTAGFNSVNTGEMHTETWLGTVILMFIGAGSGGTGGGIKVTTFAVLAVVIWSELRGEPDANLFDRRISPSTQRHALTVALLAVAIVVLPTLWMTALSPFTVDQILFEVTSAFTTTGLSTGITAQLAWYHQVVLCVLMFIGRLGPVTLGTALALRARRRLYRLPESAPIIG